MQTTLRVTPLACSVQVVQALRLPSNGVLLVCREGTSIWQIREDELSCSGNGLSDSDVRLGVEQLDHTVWVALVAKTVGYSNACSGHFTDELETFGKIVSGAMPTKALDASRIEQQPCATDLSADLHWPSCAFSLIQGWVHVVATSTPRLADHSSTIAAYQLTMESTEEWQIGRASKWL